MGNDLVVACRSVGRVYQDESVPVHALHKLDLDVITGEFLSLSGPSGSGKSTLLNIVGGLDRPDSGEVIVDGTSLGHLSEADLSKLRLIKMGFVFQAYNLIPVLSARENVEFIMQLQGVSSHDRFDRARQALDLLGILDLENRRPSELSGGQQQRVAIARAIVTNPILLLADEPSANLDSQTTKDLTDLLRDLNHRLGVTIIAATHDPLVMNYSDRQVHIRDGSITEDFRNEPLD